MKKLNHQQIQKLIDDDFKRANEKCEENRKKARLHMAAIRQRPRKPLNTKGS